MSIPVVNLYEKKMNFLFLRNSDPIISFFYWEMFKLIQLTINVAFKSKLEPWCLSNVYQTTAD